MTDHIVILHYPESDWGDDLVCFHLPPIITAYTLTTELEYRRKYKEEEAKTIFASLQDYADAMLTEVAQSLGGTWNYVAQAGTVDIEYG